MLPPVVARLVGDNTQYISSLREAEHATKGSTDKSAGHFSKLGGAMGAAMKVGAAAGIAAAGVFVTKAVGAASDLAESLSKSNTIFGDQAKAVESWASKASSSMGLSKQAALESASTFGNMFIQLGIGRDKATDMSKSMVGLATDFASFHNASQPEALEAMSAAFRGEYDAVQRFVPTINAAAVEQKALAMGLKGTTKELTAQDKALATQALLMEGAGAATGDYARTSEGFANKMREFKAKAEDFKASVGAAVIPVLLKLFEVGERLGGLAAGLAPILASGFNAMKSAFSGEGVTSDGFVGVMERIGVAARAVVDWVVANWPQIQATIAQVLATVQEIVVGFVDIVTVIWQNWGSQIVSYVQSSFQNAMAIIGGAMDVIQGIIATVTAIIHGDWSAAWDGIKQVLSGVWQVIQGLVQQALNVMRTIVSVGMNILAGIFSGAWQGIQSATSGAIGGLIGLVSSIPGRISGALGHLGSLLYDAGRSVIAGLLNGIRDAVQGVYNFVSGIAGKIRSLKGPIEKDRQLLIPAGRAIMDSLVAGLRDHEGHLVRQLAHVTGLIQNAGREAWAIGMSPAMKRYFDYARESGDYENDNIMAFAAGAERDAARARGMAMVRAREQAIASGQESAAGLDPYYQRFAPTGARDPRPWRAGDPPVDSPEWNSMFDSNRGRPGYVQAEDGSWVPTSFYGQASGGSAVASTVASTVGGGNTYNVNVYTATGDIPAETIRKIRVALFELENDHPPGSIVP